MPGPRQLREQGRGGPADSRRSARRWTRRSRRCARRSTESRSSSRRTRTRSSRAGRPGAGDRQRQAEVLLAGGAAGGGAGLHRVVPREAQRHRPRRRSGPRLLLPRRDEGLPQGRRVSSCATRRTTTGPDSTSSGCARCPDSRSSGSTRPTGRTTACTRTSAATRRCSRRSSAGWQRTPRWRRSLRGQRDGRRRPGRRRHPHDGGRRHGVRARVQPPRPEPVRLPLARHALGGGRDGQGVDPLGAGRPRSAPSSRRAVVARGCWASLSAGTAAGGSRRRRSTWCESATRVGMTGARPLLSGYARSSRCCAYRRSIRAYDETHVLGDDELVVLLEAARWSPSAATRSRGRSSWAGAGMPAPGLRRAARSLGATLGAGRVRRCSSRSTRSHPGPRRTRSATPTHAQYDLGQAVAHLTVQASALGLGVHQFAAFDHDGLAGLAGVPPHWRVTTGLAVGLAVESDLAPGPPPALRPRLRHAVR